MNEPARLFLVRPEDQPAPDANVKAIAEHIAWLLFTALPWDHYITRLHKLNLPDLIEIWYWFDEINCTHRIVILGDNLPSPDVINAENYDPYAEHAYYWFPLVLYHAFTDIRLHDSLPTPEEIAARLKIHPNLRFLTWLRQNPGPDHFITRFNTKFWSEPLRHLLSDPSASADTTRELPENVITEMEARSNKSKETSSAGDSWEATLMLLEYANRIPAVPVPKAADILKVTEKTVYNQCGKHLECIPHRGTTWVTKRSIQTWVKDYLYRPTVNLNMWNEVMVELEKQKAAAAIVQQEQQKFNDSQAKKKSL